MLKRTMIVGAVAALLGGASVAGAQTTDIFGHGGVTYQFDSVCHRVTFIPPGISDHEALNVVGQQVACLVKREKRIRACYRNATLTFLGDHLRKGHAEGDWAGVDQLKRCGSK